MVSRSEAGGGKPPAAGVISGSVIAKRPDLRGMKGHTVRVPRALDIASAEGAIRIGYRLQSLHTRDGFMGTCARIR